MRYLAVGLNRVFICGLSGWDLRDYRSQWLVTLDDIGRDLSQWCRCFHSLPSIRYWVLKLFFALLFPEIILSPESYLRVISFATTDSYYFYYADICCDNFTSLCWYSIKWYTYMPGPTLFMVGYYQAYGGGKLLYVCIIRKGLISENGRTFLFVYKLDKKKSFCEKSIFLSGQFILNWWNFITTPVQCHDWQMLKLNLFI